MSVAQNEKIRQVTETTMVIGVDIASDTHWARAFDWRGLELSKAVKFENSAEGFHYFLCWASELAAEQKKGRIMVGLEPTGHYWFTLAAYLQGGSKLQQYERIMKVVESLCRQIPEVEELLKIKGIGLITVAGIFAEVGDLRRFSSPRQLQKLAGLAITENSSGKHKGQTEISRRGRAHLRAILFRAVMPLVARNEEFQKLHHYLTTRAENPLKKMQSIIAICCKLLRVFYAVATKGCAYSAEKMLADIRRNQPLKAA